MPVAQIDKDQSAEIPPAMHPAAEPHRAARVVARQETAGVGSKRGGEHGANVTGAKRWIKQRMTTFPP